MPTYTSTTDRVQTWLDASTLHIRFNNPVRHNALSVDMWEAVPPLLRMALTDERVRLVVFSGAGEHDEAHARRPSSRAPTSRSSRTCAPRGMPSRATRRWPKRRS